MDIPLPRTRRRQLARRRSAAAALGALTLGAAAWFAARLGPQLERVPRAATWTGKVEHGSFVVQVRGSGTLRPESIRWLTAESSGRVEEVLLQPGAAVEPLTPVVRLENLDLELQAVQAQRELQGARAQALALERQTRRDRLELAAEIESLRGAADDAARRARAYAEGGAAIIAQLDVQQTLDKAAELQRRRQIAEQRVNLLEQLAPRELDTLRQQTGELTRMRDVRRQLVERLLVRASATGILQDVLVELGQWVVPGTPVAKVIIDRQLEAELRIPAEQAGAIAVGQAASIRTGFGEAGNASIAGRVRRIAPAASQGSVLVEVALEGPLPENARPDQNVDGSIETEHSQPTLHLARPVSLAPGPVSRLFRLDPATHVAERVEVRTGRVSMDRVEVLSGLAAGDEVILSDMSRYAGEAAVRIE
ncbi:MAG TPA: HlyD family efflux transporter periplasmic adaptor subunit [Polyangiaceae bacterium]|nr:HlyD family efflux transporter periplasmic adaptor subunit [Polyangiaceae bacterium]